MNVDGDYLNRFSTQIRGFPAEITLNGYERPATTVISVDDTDGTYLSVSWKDDYESPYDAVVGADKRETFVIPMRGPDPVGTVGYRFAGLILLDDLRSWYRRKHDLDNEDS
jgi:hypothetical protein